MWLSAANQEKSLKAGAPELGFERKPEVPKQIKRERAYQAKGEVCAQLGRFGGEG